MNVPFHRSVLTDSDLAAVTATLRSGWLTSGAEAQAFEREFARVVGVDHALAVGSCTAAALITFQALGVGPGSRVFVPAWTFSGPPMMARHLGATVIPCDVDPVTLNLRVEDLDGPRPGDIIMPTHFAGVPCEIDAIAEAFPGVTIVDDAAHAFPAIDASGRTVGGPSPARATIFSFYATKTLTTGEGGMITTSDAKLAATIRSLRLHGFDRPMEDRYTNPATGWSYDIVRPGWKANLADPNAALGRAQLARAEELLRARRAIGERYRAALADHVELPPVVSGSAEHLFVIRVPDRDAFIARMAGRGVQCSVHFKPLHLLSAWREVWSDVRLPNAEAAFQQTVSLPYFPSMSDAEVETVIAAVKCSLAA